MKMRRRLIIAILAIVIVIPLYGNKAEEDFIKNVMKQEELKLKERIEKIKNQKDSLYFANTSLRPHEQQKHAKKEIEKIRKLSEVDGFDIPDHKKIYEHYPGFGGILYAGMTDIGKHHRDVTSDYSYNVLPPPLKFSCSRGFLPGRNFTIRC